MRPDAAAASVRRRRPRLAAARAAAALGLAAAASPPPPSLADATLAADGAVGRISGARAPLGLCSAALLADEHIFVVVRSPGGGLHLRESRLVGARALRPEHVRRKNSRINSKAKKRKKARRQARGVGQRPSSQTLSTVSTSEEEERKKLYARNVLLCAPSSVPVSPLRSSLVGEGKSGLLPGEMRAPGHAASAKS
jgi:hypothetical protein